MGTQLPPPLKRGRGPHVLAHVCCGQMARWIRIPCGMEVGLGPGHIVLDGDQPPPKKGDTTPIFGPCYCGQTVAHLAEHLLHSSQQSVVGHISAIWRIRWTCAYWHHLENTIELVLPSAYLSPEPTWQINWFNHFCTDHGRVLLGMSMYDVSPNNCPFALGIWAPSYYMLPWAHWVHDPNGISTGSSILAQITAECCYTLL